MGAVQAALVTASCAWYLADSVCFLAAELAAKLPKSTEPEGHDGSTGAAAKDSDIAEMIEDRIQTLKESVK